MWHKAKRVQLQSGQSEVRVDFPLPIVACNLMMEYADFYENQQATGMINYFYSKLPILNYFFFLNIKRLYVFYSQANLCNVLDVHNQYRLIPVYAPIVEKMFSNVISVGKCYFALMFLQIRSMMNIRYLN